MRVRPLRGLTEESESDREAVRLSLTLLTSSLASAGCENEAVERASIGAFHAMGMNEVMLLSLPSKLVFTSPSISWGTSVDTRWSINVAEQALEVLIEVAEHPERFDAAILSIHAVRVSNLKPLYGFLLQFLAWTVLASVSCSVFFQGSWAAFAATLLASIASFVGGVIIPIVFPALSYSAGFQAGLFSGFVVKSAYSVGLALECVEGVAVSSIIVLVPGSGFTFGILDLIQGQTVSGSAKFISALVQSFLQGLGLLVGWYLAAWSVAVPITAATPCPDPISPWFLFLFTPLIWITWSIYLDGPVRRWPVYCASGLFATVITVGMQWPAISPPLPSWAPIVAASCVVGMYSSLIGRVLKSHEAGSVLVGVFSLLPGGASVWDAVINLSNWTTVSYGTSIFTTALEIAAGLAVGRIFRSKCGRFWKRKKKKRPDDNDDDEEESSRRDLPGAISVDQLRTRLRSQFNTPETSAKLRNLWNTAKRLTPRF